MSAKSAPPFTHSELLILLEAARVALRDADMFDDIAESLDISDTHMCALRDRLADYMDDYSEPGKIKCPGCGISVPDVPEDATHEEKLCNSCHAKQEGE